SARARALKIEKSSSGNWILWRERRPYRVDEAVQILAAVGLAFSETPDRTGPGGIAFVARDKMHVELRHDVAERAHVDFLTAGHALERLADHVDLEGEHGLVERREFVQLDDARTLWHQHQPWPAAVVHQPQFAQTQPHQRTGIALYARIEFESG